MVEQHLDDDAREVPGAGDATRFVGLAGNVTTVASGRIGLAEYSRDAIPPLRADPCCGRDVFRTLATEANRGPTPQSRPGPRSRRRDRGWVLRAGRIFRYFGFDDCVVSEADILDGLILSQHPH